MTTRSRFAPRLALAAAIALTGLGCQEAASADPGAPATAAAPVGGPIDGAGARALVAEGATLLDVRTPQEFAGGHLDGAINVPVQALPGGAAELPRDRPVVVYCRSGRRSAAAASMLREHGYVVHDLGPQSAW